LLLLLFLAPNLVLLLPLAPFLAPRTRPVLELSFQTLQLRRHLRAALCARFRLALPSSSGWSVYAPATAFHASGGR